MKQSNVYLIPDLIPSEASIQDSCCVVIDVLRATTTMITALGNGAQSITPVLTVEVAREVARNTNGLLGGERDCVKLPGFDFGNSPAEYTAERVGGQNIIMTTTNGTRAIMACLKSNKTLIAAFANLSAVIRHIADEPKLNIICAGTNGEITLEDTLLAGAIVSSRDASEFNDQALLARQLWEPCVPASGQAYVFDTLLQSRGGKNLQQAGMVSDIELCATLDTHTILPILSPKTKTLQL